jgi:hypothetical protein
MAEHIFKTFPHRQNRDGTFDSICPACFLTVSNRQNEIELAGDEIKHNCFDSGQVPNSASLDYYMAECVSVFNGVRAMIRDTKE